MVETTFDTDFKDFLKRKEALFQEYTNEKIMESIGAKIIISYEYFGHEKAAIVFYDGDYFEVFYGSPFFYPSSYQSLAHAETLEDIERLREQFKRILTDANRKESLFDLFQRLIYFSGSGDPWCSDSKSAKCHAYSVLAKKIREMIEENHG